MTNRIRISRALRPLALAFSAVVLLTVCLTPANSAQAEEQASVPSLVGTPLAIGDTAPSLAGVQWLSTPAGDPATPDGKTVYIVEFWATWCQPCKVTIPHLNQMYEKYKDKGLQIIGISQEKLEVAKPFFEKTKMDYPVAVDANGSAGPIYMNGIQGIPHAFLFDRTGALIWHGHPLDNLEYRIRQVLSGRLDVAKAKEINALRDSLSGERDPNKALDVFNKLITLDPANSQYYTVKINILSQTGSLNKVPAVYDEWAKGCAGSPEGLVELALSTIRQESIDLRNPELAISSVRTAVSSADADIATMLIGAQALCEMGMLDEAIAILSKPIKTFNDAQTKAINEHLSYYKKLLSLRK